MNCQTRSGIDSRIIKGETTLVDMCRDQDLKQSDVEGSTEALLKARENNLMTNLMNDPVLRLTVSLEAGPVFGKPDCLKKRVTKQLNIQLLESIHNTVTV